MSDGRCILSVAFPFAPIGPAAVGGAEVILSQLEAALASFGFTSVVVAHAGSQPQGRLYPISVPTDEITEALRCAVEASTQGQIDRALAENPIALVHMHGLDFDRYRIPSHIPVLITLHLPPAWYPEAIWSLPLHYRFVCVSASQRRACPEHAHHRITVIDNGVPLPATSSLRSEGRYALMLARICAEKNVHTGLDAARMAGMPAMLGGEVFPYEAHQRYFTEQIEPRLTHAGNEHTDRHSGESRPAEARFLGPVTGPAKTRLLARAACLLVPSLAPETSSLVAMEALAAGVPVIAMASGALPEIVADGYTGFLIPPGSDSAAVDAMAAAIRRLPTLDRDVCRTIAAERFALSRTLERYAELYRDLALEKPLVQGSTNAPPASSTAHQTTVPPLAIRHLTVTAELDALIPQWSTLWQEDGLATPFQHPAWLGPWWGQFGADGELHAIALEDANTSRLLGLLPLYVYTQPETHERQFLLLGAGTTDYLGGVWSSASPHFASEGLTGALGLPDVWDTAYLSQLVPDSPLLLAGRAAALPIDPAEPTAILDVRAELPAKLRANIGRYQRRASAHGPLTCTVAVDVAEALENLDHLVRFHETRWNGRGEAGVLSDPRVQAHHRESIPALLNAGLLRFFRLTLSHEVIGTLYALADPPQRMRRRLYLYLIGFATQAAELSPGTLLLHHVWGYARAEGFAALDFLRGGESYKHLWGAQSHATYALHVRRSLRG